MDRFDDLQVYRQLLSLVENLDATANRCHSIAAATAIHTCSHLVRVTASGLYRNSLSTCGYVENIAENGEKV